MTSQRGLKKFRNDTRYPEWIFKCETVLTETLHEKVFESIFCFMNNKTENVGLHVKKKTPSMKKLESCVKHIEELQQTLIDTNLPITDDFLSKIEPTEIMEARSSANSIVKMMEEFVEELQNRKEFWYNL